MDSRRSTFRAPILEGITLQEYSFVPYGSVIDRFHRIAFLVKAHVISKVQVYRTQTSGMIFGCSVLRYLTRTENYFTVPLLRVG
jgi:hypothetical protein